MASVLASRLSGPASSSGWRHCVVLLGKTFYGHRAFSTQVFNGYHRINAGGDPVMDNNNNNNNFI